MQLVLSLFPGIDLLGRGFEAEGYCVVRGPDLIYGGDVRTFRVPAGKFEGVIGGSPCPDFSRARRCAPSGEGVELLNEFARVVQEATPIWWMLENVPGVPDVTIARYLHTRIDLDARDCGLNQSRLRHFQYGDFWGRVPIVSRRSRAIGAASRCCVASEGGQMGRRSWADFCELQGLPRDFELPGMTLAARYRAVGNGVPVPMARVMAAAIRAAVHADTVRLCACGCARIIAPRQVTATAACRKRMQRRRDAAGVTGPGTVTPGRSRVSELDARAPGPSRVTRPLPLTDVESRP